MGCISLGNLEKPLPADDTQKSKDKIDEMMSKLHKTGFTRQQNISDGIKPGKFYHIYDMPYKIEFGGSVSEAIDIMRPYSQYLRQILITELRG